MLNRHTITLIFALVCAIGLYVVGNESMVPVASPPTKSAIIETDQAAPNASVKPNQETPDEPTGDAEEAQSIEEKPTQVAFEPPFPDRSDLFQAPKRQGRGRAQAKGQVESAVELLGFVNVDGQRVALSIDGLVTMAAEGDKQYGIEVISIQPPAVVLQRGRQRWQATFDN